MIDSGRSLVRALAASCIACIGLALASCGGETERPVFESPEVADAGPRPDTGFLADCNAPRWPPPSVEDDGYQRFELCGWTVMMGASLYADRLAPAVYETLASDLQVIQDLLPSAVVAKLRQVKFWMERNRRAFVGVYHSSPGWLRLNGYPEKWARGVHFGVARTFLDLEDIQPAVVLHELAHAWDHLEHDYGFPAVQSAYDAALNSGIYDEVPYILGGVSEAYATTNSVEYFAELSEAFHSTGPPGSFQNDFFPYDREELRAHDPLGFAAVDAAWRPSGRQGNAASPRAPIVPSIFCGHKFIDKCVSGKDFGVCRRSAK
ncbi:MAG: hypothetical protein AAFN74_13345 [Myxococcota bacterium]